MTSAQPWDLEPEAEASEKPSPLSGFWCGACVSGSYFFRRASQKGNCCSLRLWTRSADGQRALALLPMSLPEKCQGQLQGPVSTSPDCPPGASYFEPL
ncbi:hypothetical protein PAL_GLEAN10005736 [Pteropus alecto]|uniref:Uncharacterized protein n=1 Tax=Pteropus alecto TaxID=9402 RepID=L5KXE9_PTEAL|nr:hypothetical protein PAL_GLEAN10005736 [Pteropus alecto]